jgi:hypothetical protein
LRFVLASLKISQILILILRLEQFKEKFWRSSHKAAYAPYSQTQAKSGALAFYGPLRAFSPLALFFLTKIISRFILIQTVFPATVSRATPSAKFSASENTGFNHSKPA